MSHSGMAEARGRLVYQFPISHYCEKTRWNLDAKGLAYRVKNLVPGPHARVTRKLAGMRTVPVLVDGDRVVGDSTAIARYLEETYPDPPLRSSDEQVEPLVRWFDEEAGPAARHFAYGVMMRRRGAAAAALFGAYPLPVRLMGKLIASRLESTLRRYYKIEGDSIDRARDTVLAACQRIEEATDGDPSRYLVGSTLSQADITAAALLAPVLIPPGSPWAAVDCPAEFQAFSDELRQRPAGRWLLERYRLDRHRVAGR